MKGSDGRNGDETISGKKVTVDVGRSRGLDLPNSKANWLGGAGIRKARLRMRRKPDSRFFVGAGVSLALVSGILALSTVGMDYVEIRNFTNSMVQIGDRIDPQLGLPVGRDENTLIIAVSAGCRYCSVSVPFYRRLSSLEKAGHIEATLLLVTPDPEHVARAALGITSLDLPMKASVSLSAMNIKVTPTLALVDSSGEVKQVWFGRLDDLAEASVLDALQRDSQTP